MTTKTDTVQHDPGVGIQLPELADDNKQYNVRFLLLNGEDFRMTFPSTTTIKTVKTIILNERPKELLDLVEKLAAQMPERTDDLRILFLGKFLEDSKTLQQYFFGQGGDDSLTTVHITLKPTVKPSDHARDRNGRKAQCCIVQ